MPVTVRRTPGVYVTELDAFPPSIVGVQTAIPIFIGYTKKAEINGKPVFNQAIRVNSLADYEAIFGAEFEPKYTITAVADNNTAIAAGSYDFKVFDPTEKTGGMKAYTLQQTSSSKFNLYNSMRLFYANGGGSCFIVSVGDYDNGGETTAGVQVSLDALSKGLTIAGEQVGPTMVVIPDAILLPAPSGSEDPFQSLTRAMLLQCAILQDRVAILDVSNALAAIDDTKMREVIDKFRVDVEVDNKARSYGMAYFPWLHTSVVSVDEFDYTNIDTESEKTLKDVLGWQNDALYKGTPRHTAIQADITALSTGEADPKKITKLNQNLTAALPLLLDIERIMAAKNDVLPPSGAMAGVFAANDRTKGVWNAPANVALNSVMRTTYKLNDAQQGDLNVPVDGKAVDAIREFVGRGTVVWGARTLDGNSNDWRYIQVRRTIIYIEQSIKNALDPFVFAANDGNTWTKVTSMVSNFLQGVWQQGGLLGSKADEAFSVQCGLGSTMTAQDVLEGYMIVQVTLQMIRPAEFIELTFKQKMGN